MASIGRDCGGQRRILFVAPDGKRKTVRLGKVSQRVAESIKTKVEYLVVAAITGSPLEDEVAQWVADLDTVMANKLAAVGLISKRQTAILAAFLDAYIAGRADAKPATKEIWGQGKRGLIDYFGADKRVKEITAGDADSYKMHLIAQGLASMTVRKRLQFAKMVFRAMVRWKLLAENPFSDVNVKATMAAGRQQFITSEETAKVLEACPNMTWRAIVGLSRYGGLRCPSEVCSLRWLDIDWDGERIRVTSPKTAHHPGKDTRTIPLFPELRSILAEAFEEAPEGSVYVCGERYRKQAMGVHGWRNINLRTRMLDIVRKAGLKQWPRLFHNLRASRETELCERFPLHVVAGWLGNTPTIAQRHYLQITEQHFKQALEPAKGAAQNPAQQPSESPRNNPQRQPHTLEFAEKCEGVQRHAYTKADGRGFEPPVDFRPQRFSRPPP